MAKTKYNKGDSVIITKHLNMPYLEGTVVTIIGLCLQVRMESTFTISDLTMIILCVR